MATETQNGTNRDQIEMLVAEMMNLMADTLKKEDEREVLRDEREKLREEREKLRAESREMWTEARWYPVWVGAALLAAGAALAKLFLT